MMYINGTQGKIMSLCSISVVLICFADRRFGSAVNEHQD